MSSTAEVGLDRLPTPRCLGDGIAVRSTIRQMNNSAREAAFAAPLSPSLTSLNTLPGLFLAPGLLSTGDGDGQLFQSKPKR